MNTKERKQRKSGTKYSTPLQCCNSQFSGNFSTNLVQLRGIHEWKFSRDFFLDGYYWSQDYNTNSFYAGQTPSESIFSKPEVHTEKQRLFLCTRKSFTNFIPHVEVSGNAATNWTHEVLHVDYCFDLRNTGTSIFSWRSFLDEFKRIANTLETKETMDGDGMSKAGQF